MRIAISAFMHDSAVAAFGQRPAVLHDTTLVDRQAELIARPAAAQRQSRCRY